MSLLYALFQIFVVDADLKWWLLFILELFENRGRGDILEIFIKVKDLGFAKGFVLLKATDAQHWVIGLIFVFVGVHIAHNFGCLNPFEVLMLLTFANGLLSL